MTKYTPNFIERIFCAACYATYGLFSVIYLIGAFALKKNLSNFSYFNIYQSIVFSLALYIISLIFSIARDFLSAMPFIGDMVIKFSLFFNGTPIYFNHTLWGLILLVFVSYLALVCMLGKCPIIPYITNMVSQITRR